MTSARPNLALDIKTKSIEQTLLPFVNQISVLVNHKERPVRNARIRDAFRRVGKEVQVAVDRFVMIGEQVAEDYPQIHEEMALACREAHEAGYSIWHVTSDHFSDAATPRSSDSRNNTRVTEKSRLSLLREKQAVLRAARFLLQSVTKVLLLADKVLIFQILDARDKISHTLLSMSVAATFSEFVQLFSQYGAEMVQLAHLSGERLSDLKDDKRRAQLASARYVLEKTTTLLLTTSKLYLRHSDCDEARIARDIVYARMHDALLLLSHAVTDGDAFETIPDASSAGDNIILSPSQLPRYIPSSENAVTLVNSLQQLEDAIDMIRISDEPLPSTTTTAAGKSTTTKDLRYSSMQQAFKTIEENVLDFTDCSDVPQQSRQHLIMLTESIRSSLSTITEQTAHPDALTANTVHIELHRCQKLAQDMTKALQETALLYANDTLTRLKRDDEHLHDIRRSAITHGNNLQMLDNACATFITKGDGLREVTRMLKHAAQKYSLLVKADQIEGTLQALQKQIVYSAQVLVKHPTSKIARENLEVFFEAWLTAVKDVAALAMQSANAGRESRAIRMGYMSLPRPGRHGAAPRIPKPKAVELCLEDQSKLAKHGLEMKLITSEMDAEAERWGVGSAPSSASSAVGYHHNIIMPPLHEYAPPPHESPRFSNLHDAVTYDGSVDTSSATYRPPAGSARAHSFSPTNLSADVGGAVGNGGGGGGGGGNDIVSRAKSMSTLAFQMYLFTRGEGPLRTTQDLFIQAEQFAEEANRLFKVVRDFAVHVPTGVARAELMTNLDSVPPHVQRLLSSLKQPTVGKPATFNKVDAVIQETKHLMNAIAKVVTTCFICATKYDIDTNLRAGASTNLAGRKQQTTSRIAPSVNNTRRQQQLGAAVSVARPPQFNSRMYQNNNINDAERATYSDSHMPNLAYYYSSQPQNANYTTTTSTRQY